MGISSHISFAKAPSGIRRKRYKHPKYPCLPIDDGMAMGYTVIAGAKFVRERKPKGLILAIPVCSEFAYNLVKEFFDKIVCLEVVKSIFFAVGMFYEDFRQISDEELIEFLTNH